MSSVSSATADTASHLHQLEEIDLASIRLDGQTQTRAGLSQAVVAEYAELIGEEGYTFPPLTAYRDPDGVLWLAAGFHRHAAYLKAGIKSALCEIRDGGQRDALECSLVSNAAHGLQRSPADKRRALEICLTDPEWSKLSNTQLAEKCGVSLRFVKEWRPKLKQVVHGAPPERRVGRDGKTYTMPEKPATPLQMAHQREPGDESEPTGDDPIPPVPVAAYCNAKPEATERRSWDRHMVHHGTVFNDKAFDQMFGELIRYIDAKRDHDCHDARLRHGSNYRKGSHPRYDRCNSAMGELCDAFKEWQSSGAFN